MNFENHIKQICTKSMAKIKAEIKIGPFLNKDKRNLLMNAFFKSQFSYCLLSWIFHSYTLNNKINRLQEKCLRIICNNKTSSFTELLDIANSVSIHQNFFSLTAFKKPLNSGTYMLIHVGFAEPTFNMMVSFNL